MAMLYTCMESVVAEVVRCWTLDQRVVFSSPGWIAVLAFLSKVLNLHCLSAPRSMIGYPVNVVHEYMSIIVILKP